MDTIVIGLQWYVVFLFSTTVHEASHALAALKLGDRTAYDGGQVTLDPLPHIRREPFGTVVVPLLSFFLAGWMMGWASAPYSREWALRNPKRSAMMSLAGPLSNLVMLFLAIAAIRAGMAADYFVAPDRLTFSHVVEARHTGLTEIAASMLSLFFSLNLLLFLFNLMPVPPLDGSGIVPLFLSHATAVRYMHLLYNSPAGFFGLFLAWSVFKYLYSPAHSIAIAILYPEMVYR